MSEEMKNAFLQMFKDKDFLRSISDSLAMNTPSTSKESPSVSLKRKYPESSPLRLKKVKVPKAQSRGECSAGSPSVVGKLPEPDNGACDSPDEFNILEQILADSDEDFSDNEDQDEEGNQVEDMEEEDESSDLEFDVLGGPPEATWKLDKKVMKWFLNVADIELKKESLESIKKAYQTKNEVASHFEPPKLPHSIWQAISQSNHADLFRLKTIHKAQESLYLATCPLLSALEKVDKSLRSELCTAIQLVSSTNLMLNRYRRASILPHIKKELRSQIRNLPITHDNLFKENFEKSADSLLKEQAALSKVMLPKKLPVQQRLGKQTANFKGSTGNNNSFRGGKGRGPHTKRGGYSRGRGRGYAKAAGESTDAAGAGASSSGTTAAKSA